VRIGILGAARIAPTALVRPARIVGGVEVVAIAARDPVRAARAAARYGIPRVHPTYEALIADPELDAVYVPLPNGLHGYWTRAAIEAGKHVLCEKPFAANAEEAEAVAAVARPTGLVVMEAFHYRYHPLFERALELVRGGHLGRVVHAEAALCFPLPWRTDIRWRLELAGGALMDVGCYPIHMLRHLLGSEPTVTAATGKLRLPGVDRAMTVELRFDDATTARAICSLWSARILQASVRVVAEQGELRIVNPMARGYHRLSWRARGTKHVEQFTRRPTYAFQLEAFRRAVEEHEPYPTNLDDAIANMRVLDAAYRAAGLEPRVPTPLVAA
jgi:predicted dehydrogenase